MGFIPFKQDIDELIDAFSMGNSTSLAEMKRIWLLRKFSFIFEASPSTNQACFMQSLYAHSIGFMVSSSSLSARLGGLYCLYCLYETQPFKPPFKIYLSLGEMRRLKELILDAKANEIKVASSLVKHMLQRNLFLFGLMDITDGSMTERINELADIQNASVQLAHKKLLANTKLENFIHMDLGMELDVDLIKKRSKDYATAKELAIKEASGLVDLQNIKHIAENQQLIGDKVEKTAKDWDIEKDNFYLQTGTQSSEEHFQPDEFNHSKRQKLDEDVRQKALVSLTGQDNVSESDPVPEDDGGFGKELEDTLLALPYESDNEVTDEIKPLEYRGTS